ncbi:MAG: Asp-tRNA(Asn)/Glu-tRNA(Gln) amidotransferase subunit GatC [Candidatus Nealsonbacteria bacterium]|nr:MAG: Asp-tRNA(Asn)/Glu-tRNA(Gln) amidotransferase subunit GatC [Candidatus Nealsonbacteria bacterium]
MISKKEVQHVANLARLGLSEKEMEEMQKELSAILDYIEKLKEVDISGVDFFISSGKLKNVMREDKEDEKSKLKNKKLLELAPEEKGGYLKVKQIL